MDTRFSSAIHALIMIAGADKPINSELIAQSIGTNASYIRKIAGLLKKRGIIDSRQGVSGFTLLVKPEELSLYSIYQAIDESEQVHMFDLHQNPNDKCVVGRHILPVLTDVFRSIEKSAELELKNTTLADCMEKMKTEIDKE
ncbi:MAG: Rrf2 family transcriptional regulator [Clostridia bacterium]|nr:Rrf2 family transcriptional regulator [Clostridia bacterium]